LFAPVHAGDGQTRNWRIIRADQARQRPWTAVGNFLVPGLGGYCSGVLVAPQVVLTANHCLYTIDYNRRDAAGNPGLQRVAAERFVFIAGVHDEAHADAVPVAEVITGGWTPGSADIAKDWAIAILARPVRADITPFRFMAYDVETAAAAWRRKLLVAAYPGASFAFSTVLRVSLGCSMLHSAPRVVIHDCPSELGSSGGPILVADGDELVLVGIHSSSRRLHPHVKHGVSVNALLGPLEAALRRVRQ
jgi:protease YdgD